MKKIIITLFTIFALFGCAEDENTNIHTYFDVKWEDISHYLPAEYPAPYLKQYRALLGMNEQLYQFIDKVEIESRDEMLYLDVYIYDTESSFISYGAYDSYINQILPFYADFKKDKCNTIKSNTVCNIYGCYIDKEHYQCNSDGSSNHHNINIFYENNEYNYLNGYMHIKFTIKL